MENISSSADIGIDWRLCIAAVAIYVKRENGMTMMNWHGQRYGCIVPECSGRITDSSGRPLENACVRMSSYGKNVETYTNANGEFHFPALHKWLSPICRMDIWILDNWDDKYYETVAGNPDAAAGPLCFYVETAFEKFLLFGPNPQPSKYDLMALSEYLEVKLFGKYPLVIWLPETTPSGREARKKFEEDFQNKQRAWFCEDFYFCKNFWTGQSYVCFRPVDFLEKGVPSYSFRIEKTIMTFHPDFVKWLKKNSTADDRMKALQEKLKRRPLLDM